MNKIVRIALCMLTVGTFFPLAAQNTSSKQKDTPKAGPDKPAKVKASLYGFVRNYFIYDSRATYATCGGEFNTIPYDTHWNVGEGNNTVERADLNAIPSTSFLALTTRIGLNLEGPTILNANSSGRIETDFAGFGTTNSVLRLRLAYVKLNWQKNTLLAGQDWHPMSSSTMPEVLDMAAGSPFRPHSRAPQIRYEFNDNHFGVMAAALYQFQYTSSGPLGSTASYANNSLLPEAFLGLSYRSAHISTHWGASVLSFRPRIFDTANYGNIKVAMSDHITSVSPTWFFQYKNNLFDLQFRTTYAQNTSHLGFFNGYGVTHLLADGSYEYAPMRASVSFLNIAYGQKCRANLFLGYMKNFGVEGSLYNFGSTANPTYIIHTRNNVNNIDALYRIAPSLSYNLQAFNFGIEYEYTAVNYGTTINNNGTMAAEGLHSVVDHRVCVLIKYNF